MKKANLLFSVVSFLVCVIICFGCNTIVLLVKNCPMFSLLNNILTLLVIALISVILTKLKPYIINTMTEQCKQNLVNDAKGLSKWFSVSVTIKIFGVTILEFHYPPQKS